jgi:hypothetical protein
MPRLLREPPGTPWEIEIDRLMREAHLSLSEARDRVVWSWLREGDVRPLAALLLDEYEPSYLVRRTLAWMLLGDDKAEHLPEDLADRAPFRLEVKSRSSKAGRRLDPENATRDRLLAENVDRLRREGVPYKVAIATVFDAVRASGSAIGEQTIRDAYDALKGKERPD